MIHKEIKINHTAVSNSMNTRRILILMLMTASAFVLSAGVGAAEDVNVILDPTLNKISGEIENKEVLNLENGYTIKITDIDKDYPYKIRLILENDSVELDNKIIETENEYSWNNNGDHITLNVEIFVGTGMDVVFFNNVYQISNGNTIIDNETFTIIYSSGSSGSLNLNAVDYSNIDGFTTSNGNLLQSSNFPPASGYSQEFLKENYSLTLLQVDVDGNEAWISLSNNSGEVYNGVVSVGESCNYNSLLSFKLDKVFVGTSSNYIEISNIYQYSEIDSSVIVQNESALLLGGLNGKFILTGGGLEWQLEENYKLHAIDIDIAGHSREAMLLIIKDGTPVDYTIISVSDSYTYYKNENLILTADLETIFSGEGVSMVRLNHVYQYSGDTGETLLSDAMHLYSVGDTREVEWQLNQNYSLSAMDIDSKDTPRKVWLRLNKDGNTLEDKFVYSGDSAIFYNSGTKILDLNMGTIFDGTEADLVFISGVYQYSETNENDILLENEPYIFIFGYSTGNDWQLYENYTLSFMDIDIKEDPNQVWLRMKKNGVPVDDNVVAQSEEYRYYNNSVLLFEGYIKSAFGGRYLDMLTLTNANQYSEFDSTPLITDATYSFYPGNVEIVMDSNEKLSLYENYTIVPVDVQLLYYPNSRYYHTNESLWLRLYKDDVMVDEEILSAGQDYSYYSAGQEIISTNLDAIFIGMNTELIKFEDFYQYSELDGSLLKYYGDILLRLGYYSPPGAPAITSFEPTTLISDVEGATRKFTIFVDQSVNVNWYINGTEIQFNESVSNAEYTNISAVAGTWIISAIANNANGIATQNWTWTVMAENESSSEFISIGSASAPMNSTITVPISVANVTNISGIYFELLYNSSVAIVSNVSTNESFTGSGITPNIDNVDGITSIVLTNPNLISTQVETPVIDITFIITGGFGSSTSLDLQNVEFSDAEFNPYTPADVVDGQITVGIKGDFNGNGIVDIGDVAIVAFMVAGNVPEDLNADFNGNGRVDIGDAAKIAAYLAGNVSEL
ncbi:MAG: hypothetical protein GQ533_02500 [Methanosarcinaceae archaeon]|nr:hypothetical protein [Methanosarcinaceae archaeon]